MTQPTFAPGTPRLLFEGNYLQTSRDYAISPDGQRFVMIKQPERTAFPTEINLVLNWFDELRVRVPAR